MNTYLPPSKTPVSEQQVARFNVLYRKIHARMAPGTAEEHSLCNEIIVGLWHFRSFRSRAQILERELKQLNPGADDAGLRKAIAAALRQAKTQKNFAWRRRNKFFAMKTERENQARLPMAA